MTVKLNLDGTGKHQIDTGLPFLDHMLAQMAVHGLFDLEIQATGDLHIDPHHTLEDVGLTLGSSIPASPGRARRDRAHGLHGSAHGRQPGGSSAGFLRAPVLRFSGEWTLPSVGGLPNTLFVHFLESFAQTARCNLHARLLYGRDDHHKAEALFKALGRAACAATRLDPRRGMGSALQQRELSCDGYREAVLIDAGTGNLHSVENALRSLGVRLLVTSDPHDLLRPGRVILPGVGAFAALCKACAGTGWTKPCARWCGAATRSLESASACRRCSKEARRWAATRD